jgi:hypothetical protein
VEVLPSGKGNRAFWSDHGNAFVVTCSGDREKKNSKEAKLLRSQKCFLQDFRMKFIWLKREQREE